MKCKCKAKPKPDVTWFRGTTAVKESAKIKIHVVDKEEDVYELSLEIKVHIKNVLQTEAFLGFLCSASIEFQNFQTKCISKKDWQTKDM